MSQYGTPIMHHNGLNCGSTNNNNTHKRTTSKPDPFSLYVPSPKRQQLNSLWSMESQSSNPMAQDLSTKAMFDSLFDEKPTLESQEEAPKLPTDLSELDDDGNIANSPAYIKSLISLVQAPDEGYSDDCLPISREESANRLASESNNIPSLVDVKNETVEANNNNMVEEIENIVDEEDDTDDAFLSNLPTSVDDLQNKELHLRLERHYSSPMVSRRQSPALYVGRSSLASESSYHFGSAHSVVSDDDEELDAEDLEVAMINESFEEQQKQSMLYEGADLKSLFYSMPNHKLSNAVLDDAQMAYILNQSNPSPPQKMFDCADGSHASKTDFDYKDLMLTPSAADYETDKLALLLTPNTRSYMDGAMASNTNFSNSFNAIGGSPPHLDEEFSSDGLNTQMENMILRGEFDINPHVNATSSKKNSLHEVESAFFDSLSATCDTPETLATEAAEALAKNVVASLFTSDSSPCRSFGVEENINLTDAMCKTLGFLSDSDTEDVENETPLKEKISTVDSGADLTSSSSQADFNDMNKAGSDEQKVPEGVLDSWEDFDESELEQKLAETVKMKQLKKSPDNILDVPSTSDTNFDGLPHVLEASNFNAKTTDEEINDTLALMGFENAWCKRVDDGHALIVFPSSAKAVEASMSKRYSCIRLRPLSESAALTQQKALAWKSVLKPNVPRPATNVSVARRMVENTLGLRSTVSKEQRLKEQQELKLARASKKLKQSLWGDNE